MNDYKPRFWTVSRFCREGGFGRTWYYAHKDDPGVPKQVIGPTGRPVLLADECEAFLARFAHGEPGTLTMWLPSRP